MVEPVTTVTDCPDCSYDHCGDSLHHCEPRTARKFEVPLHVSVWYSRSLVLLGLAIAVTLLWAAGISDLWSLVLFLPLGF